jgi:hypothetical protein
MGDTDMTNENNQMNVGNRVAGGRDNFDFGTVQAVETRDGAAWVFVEFESSPAAWVAAWMMERVPSEADDE